MDGWMDGWTGPSWVSDLWLACANFVAPSLPGCTLWVHVVHIWCCWTSSSGMKSLRSLGFFEGEEVE